MGEAVEARPVNSNAGWRHRAATRTTSPVARLPWRRRRGCRGGRGSPVSRCPHRPLSAGLPVGSRRARWAAGGGREDGAWGAGGSRGGGGGAAGLIAGIHQPPWHAGTGANGGPGPPQLRHDVLPAEPAAFNVGVFKPPGQWFYSG